jgi:hypothetical protein
MFSSRKETFGSPCILVLLNKYTNGRIHRVQLIRHQRFLFLSTYKTADSSGKKKRKENKQGVCCDLRREARPFWSSRSRPARTLPSEHSPSPSARVARAARVQGRTTTTGARRLIRTATCTGDPSATKHKPTRNRG